MTTSNHINSLKTLSDTELLERLDRLNQKEREATLSVLLHLVELDRRRLYLELGYGSLFDYCVRRMRYSKSSAGRRIRTARCMRDYPEIYDLLSAGEVNLCSVSRIAGILTEDNKDIIISGIRNKSMDEVDDIVSRHRPECRHRDRVRPVYIKRMVRVSEIGAGDGAAESRRASGSGEETPGDLVNIISLPMVGAQNSPTPGGEAGGPVQGTREETPGDLVNIISLPMVGAQNSPTPGGEGGGAGGVTAGDNARSEQDLVILEKRFKLEFTVNPEFMEKLERARALLSNKYPRGLEFERLFEIMLDDYLDRNSPEGRAKRRAKRQAKKKEREAQAVRPQKNESALEQKLNTKQAVRGRRPDQGMPRRALLPCNMQKKDQLLQEISSKPGPPGKRQSLCGSHQEASSKPGPPGRIKTIPKPHKTKQTDGIDKHRAGRKQSRPTPRSP